MLTPPLVLPLSLDMADQLEKAKAFARSRTAAREAEKAVPPAIQAAWVRGDFGDDHGFNTVMEFWDCLLYTSPSPRDQRGSRMPSSA